MTQAPRLSRSWSRLTGSLRGLPLNQQLILSGVLVGIAAGASACVFALLIDFFHDLGFGHLTRLPVVLRVLGFVCLPALGGAIAGLMIHFWCPELKGHGIAEVIEAIEQRGGRIHGRVAWVKAVASAATIGLGGSAGREGPIVQIGAAVGSWLGRLLRVDEEILNTLVAGGVAGGLSATFGIPLAGVFFTMEVVLRNFANEAFPAVVIAAVTASVIPRLLLGEGHFFAPVAYEWRGVGEIVYYAALGLLCAPLGTLYRASLRYFEGLFATETNWGKGLNPAVGGFLTGVVALALPQVLGTGRETINDVLHGGMTGWILAALVFGKILATSLTLGSGGSGGTLMPSLFVGAMAGGAWGRAVALIPGAPSEPGANALVGMACVFAAAFQAPITAMVLAFEVSRDYDIIGPVMVAAAISFLFSRKRPGGTRP